VYSNYEPFAAIYVVGVSESNTRVLLVFTVNVSNEWPNQLQCSVSVLLNWNLNSWYTRNYRLTFILLYTL